jgi:hypothetical protein
MPDYIDENADFTEDFRTDLPEILGDAYYNDPETKQQPTKELDNVKNLADMAKMVVTGSRKISAHGVELKNATAGMVKIPGEGATEDEIAAYRTAQGVPPTPEGYELPIPEVPEEDKAGFETIAKGVKDAAHEAGIPPSKLSTVWVKVANAIAAQNKALEQKGTDLLAADIQALKDSKKEKYDSFIADTNKVAAHFDIKADATLGTKDNLIGGNFMKLMTDMGIKDVPVVREFLGAIAPLVLEGKTLIGRGVNQEGGEKWFTDYDETGKESENEQ